jgi:hypothetical protein
MTQQPPMTERDIVRQHYEKQQRAQLEARQAELRKGAAELKATLEENRAVLGATPSSPVKKYDARDRLALDQPPAPALINLKKPADFIAALDLAGPKQPAAHSDGSLPSPG